MGSTYAPVIKYRQTGGNEITFQSGDSQSHWKVGAGDQIDVLVNRNDPQDAQLAGFLPN